jgi:hypothetical protein
MEWCNVPIKSAKQFKFFQAMAHGDKKKGKGIGPSESVAKEFIHKTPMKKRSMFAKMK